MVRAGSTMNQMPLRDNFLNTKVYKYLPNYQTIHSSHVNRQYFDEFLFGGQFPVMPVHELGETQVWPRASVPRLPALFSRRRPFA